TQTLQPSVGLPATNQSPVILAGSSQTTMSEVAPASDNKDFFASYYSLPAPDKSSIVSTPKVLAAQTTKPAETVKNKTSKIMIVAGIAIVSILGLIGWKFRLHSWL
ncbi:MAG: hypothetical protein AAB541_02150, partial [Patescibacteria group bacterium]